MSVSVLHRYYITLSRRAVPGVRSERRVGGRLPHLRGKALRGIPVAGFRLRYEGRQNAAAEGLLLLSAGIQPRGRQLRDLQSGEMARLQVSLHLSFSNVYDILTSSNGRFKMNRRGSPFHCPVPIGRVLQFFCHLDVITVSCLWPSSSSLTINRPHKKSQLLSFLLRM